MSVPFKTMVMYSTYTAGRDPKYVADPTSFKPERWTKNSEENLDAFISLPFGFGPRSCYGNVNFCLKIIIIIMIFIGQRLVELELYTLLAKVSVFL